MVLCEPNIAFCWNYSVILPDTEFSAFRSILFVLFFDRIISHIIICLVIIIKDIVRQIAQKSITLFVNHLNCQVDYVLKSQ